MFIQLFNNICFLILLYKYLNINKDCIGPSYEPYQFEHFIFGIIVGFFLKKISLWCKN